MESIEGFVKLVGKVVRCGCLFVGCYRMKTEFVIGNGSYRIGHGWNMNVCICNARDRVSIMIHG